MPQYLSAGTVLTSPKTSYRIESVLGKGGFGITYKATVETTYNNLKVRVPVAIKEHFVSKDCERDVDGKVSCSRPAKERVERSCHDFLKEARRLQQIGVGHTNIVSVDEVFQANNTAYYVMEYLDGKSLRNYVESKPGGKLDEKEALEFFELIINAVGGLHNQHITHLDIKPDNIMLRRDINGRMEPVLIDFGLSKHYETDGTPTSTTDNKAYSPGYSSLEQMVGIINGFSPVSDIYSLAATLYFCLSGKTPPMASPELPSQLPGMLKGLCSEPVAEAIIKGMQAERLKRQQSCGELLADLGLAEHTVIIEEEKDKDKKEKDINGGGDTVVVDVKPRTDDPTPIDFRAILRKIGKIVAIIVAIAVLGLLGFLAVGYFSNEYSGSTDQVESHIDAGRFRPDSNY